MTETATPEASTQTAKARVRRTPEQVAKQIEEEHAAKLAKLEQERQAKLKKAVENSVPMSKRKTAAFELLTKMRETVRKANGNADLALADVDEKIVAAVDAAFVAED